MRRRSSPDRILRIAVIGLLLYGLGLIPLYLLTPAREILAALRGASAALVDERAFLSRTPGAAPGAGARPAGGAAATPRADQTPAAVPTAAAGDERYAVLLMGYGGAGHDGAYLTDSLMVVIVDPAHLTLTLLSIPRDSWVPLLFDGQTPVYNKINTAYAFAKDPTLYPDRLPRYTGAQGPGNFAMDTVARVLGIPIRYYVALDFQGFREMIDAVGGIDVAVPDSFTARYPKNDDPAIDASWTVVRFTRGTEHMDGERALEYARARETLDNPSEGTDFARSRRQRQILEAFKERLLQPGGLIHLPQLMGIAAQHVDTNYTIPDVAHLGQLILGWRNVTIFQTALTSANYLEEATGPDGAYLLVPSAPDQSWRQIRAFARHLWADPAVGVEMASTAVVVENDTDVAGLAARASAALLALGYRVGEPRSGPVRAHSRVVDQTGGAPHLVQQVARDLGLTQAEVVDPSDDGSGTILVQLGEDAAGLTFAVPEDAEAPASRVGVIKAGVWPYVPPTPTPPPAPRRVGRPLPPTATPTPRPEGAPRVSRATPTPTAADGLVSVPDLIGLPEAAAQQLITASGLQTSYVNYQTIADVPDRRYFLSIPPGHVLSQTPAPGMRVPRGTRVLIAVRKE